MDVPRTIRWGLAAVGVGTVVLAGCSSGSASHGSSAAAGPTSAASTASTASSAAPATSAPTAAPLTLRSERTALGTLLADPRGFTLYTFKLDKSRTSACTGACATVWPPFTVGSDVHPVAPKGLAGTLATITRAGGAEQVSFDGRPLYRFSGDTAPGETRGEDVKGLWFVVRIGGAPRPSTVPAQPTPRSVAPTHSASASASASASRSATPSRAPTTHPPKPSPSPTNCIPQNGGGDGDGDNNGGPSDGDGCT